MDLKTIVDALELEVKSAGSGLQSEVSGAYVSDLLSDVISNSNKGNLWITLQVHPNIVAVASLKDLSGIILVNGRQPEEQTLKKAKEEKIAVLTSRWPTFQLVGKLYKLIGEC